MKPAPSPLEVAKRTVQNVAAMAATHRKRIANLEVTAAVLAGAVLWLLVRK